MRYLLMVYRVESYHIVAWSLMNRDDLNLFPNLPSLNYKRMLMLCF
jgi:hypothetical protein